MSDWQTAPREPTYEMVQAGAATPEMKAVESMVTIAAIHGAGLPMVDWNKSAIACAYRAMLAAAVRVTGEPEASFASLLRIADAVRENGWDGTADMIELNVKDLRAVLAVSFPIQQDWQPIASAPKDGTKILACREGGRVSIWRWSDDRYAKQPRPFWSSMNSKTTDRANQPTHWMPLPAPPIQQDADDIGQQEPGAG